MKIASLPCIALLLCCQIAYSQCQNRICRDEWDVVSTFGTKVAASPQIKEIEIKEYIIKNDTDSLSVQLQSLIKSIIVKSKQNSFYLSFASRDSSVYLIIQDWPLWSLIETKNAIPRIYGVYELKDKDVLKKFIILNSGGDTTARVINELFVPNNNLFCYKRRTRTTGHILAYDKSIIFVGKISGKSIMELEYRLDGRKIDSGKDTDAIRPLYVPKSDIRSQLDSLHFFPQNR